MENKDENLESSKRAINNAIRDERIIAGLISFVKEYGPVFVPENYKVKKDDDFALGTHIQLIRRFLKGVKVSVKYSPELIKAIGRINPSVVDLQNYRINSNIENLKKAREVVHERKMRKLEEKKQFLYEQSIKRGVQVFTRVYGKLAIPCDYKFGEDDFPVGEELSKIRDYLVGKGDKTYSKDIIKEIDEINPKALDLKTCAKIRELKGREKLK